MTAGEPCATPEDDEDTVIVPSALRHRMRVSLGNRESTTLHRTSSTAKIALVHNSKRRRDPLPHPFSLKLRTDRTAIQAIQKKILCRRRIHR